jgi:hypothetical protein
MLARLFLALGLTAFVTPATALAAPPIGGGPGAASPKPGVAAVAPKRRYLAPKPKEPTAPAPSVTLTIDAPSTHNAWKMRVENTGDVPVRLVADARLLTFELSSDPEAGKKKAKKPIVCALPVDMRPLGDVDRALVLAPKRAYSETFDPRLYCFGTKSGAALAAGTHVVGHLGWMKSHGTSAPFVVSPFEGVEPEVRAVKELVSGSVDIGPDDAPRETLASTHPPPPKAGDDPYPTKLSISSPKHVDVETTRDLSMTVHVKNEGVRSVTVLLRPETLAFEVTGPEHTTSFCGWPVRVGGTVREAFATLHPKRGESVSVLLDALCPDSTFDHPGLYVVRPRLDTRHADGEEVGLTAFAGEIIGTQTTLLRVHRGDRPARNVRPVLDPQERPAP